MEEFKQVVEVTPGYDKTKEKPNYGVGAMTIRFVLIGSKGAVQFVIGTEWYPVEVQRRMKGKLPRVWDVQPNGWDVGYHSREPVYKDHDSMGTCSYLDDVPCYYDGSSLQAQDWVPDFITGGTTWLWSRLEEYYKAKFETPC